MSEPTIRPFCDRALELTSHGFPVFPVHSIREGNCTCRDKGCRSPGKHPMWPNWQQDATVERTALFKWSQKSPFANIGIKTGNGLVVLDIDPRNGGNDSLTELEQHFGKLPETVIVLTGGGGTHYYFRTMADSKIGSKSGIRPGIDVKSEGGFVVAPGSLHKSGGQYTFDLCFHPDEGTRFLPPPLWLLALLRDQSQRRPVTPHEWIVPISEGSRNEKITRLAGHLISRELNPRIVQSLMLGWNLRFCLPPLPDSEVSSTVDSICKSHLKNLFARRNKGVEHG